MAEYPDPEAAGISKKKYKEIIKDIKRKGAATVPIEYDITKFKVKLENIDRKDFVLYPHTARNQKEAQGKFFKCFLTFYCNNKIIHKL